MNARSYWLAGVAIATLWVASATATPPGSNICPIHGVKMEAVARRVVYGMPSQLEFEEMRVAKSQFPFGRDYVLGGCVLKSTKTVEGFLCPRCVEARKAWLEGRKRSSSGRPKDLSRSGGDRGDEPGACT
jgi:hypothetical protein